MPDQRWPGLRGDEALSIVADVGNGTPEGASKVEYGPDQQAFRKSVQDWWDGYRRDHPTHHLDVPNDGHNEG